MAHAIGGSGINEGASEIDSKSVPHQGSSECESTDAKRPKIMAPVLPGVGKTPKGVVEEYIDSNKVVIFSKSTCPYCVKVKNLFGQLGVEFCVVELNQIENGPALQDALEELSGQRTVPNVFVNKTHLGGCDDTERAHRENRLAAMLKTGEEAMSTEQTELESYDYDLVVIGGGSGGLAASKDAADLGAKVAVLDYVKPSEKGTTWGLGGTCVNVGCIPKKLMHQAAILGHSVEDAQKFGWELNDASAKHQWDSMRDAIQDHIGGLNWGYRVSLRSKEVTYINSYGEFVGPHKLKCTNRKGKTEEITAKYFIVATGCRPKYPTMPGVKEFGITSDDLFSLPYCPGKTLVIGASYVSLECAGFSRSTRS
ncbi:Thioredoxin reductase 3 [Lamellibrachia satsuma]|nr:Thioredoxin reductase 3 [Lamellibrachia satsuma]